MTATIALLENGYKVIQVMGYHNIFRAYNDMTGDDFLFTVRGKQSASFRRKTSTWEFGIDAPEYDAYIAVIEATKAKELVIFFDVESPPSTRWMLASDVKIVGRFWRDWDNFPNGIYFVPVASTHEWRVCKIFTIKER